MFLNKSDLYEKALKKYAGDYVYNQVKLNGENQLRRYMYKHDLTVLFADVNRITILNEKLPPEMLMSLLDIYVSTSFEHIEKNNGTIINLNGDEIVAVFGLNDKSHAFDACHVALNLSEKVNEQIDKNTMPRLSISIGINSGEMLIGNLGSDTKLIHTIMGDHVNLAARLVNTNRVYNSDILISEFTHNAVKDKFITRELDIIRIKGLKNPLKIYELIGE